MKKLELDSEIENRIALALRSETEDWTPDCLAPEQIISLVERSLIEEEAAALMAHVALCARCRREFAETVELVQLSEEVTALESQAETKAAATASPTLVTRPETPVTSESTVKRPGTSFWQRWFAPGVGFSLGAAAAGTLLFFAWNSSSQLQREKLASLIKKRDVQTAQLETDKRNLALELDALKKQKQGDAARLVSTVSRLNSQVKAQNIQIARLGQSEAALEQMPLPTADWLGARENGQVRSASQTGSSLPVITLVHPLNTAIQDTTPRLEWLPVPGAKEYNVSLEMESSNEELPPLKRLSSTQWQVSTPLPPGRVYQWAVSAKQGDKQIHSRVAKFSVLSAAQTREIASARRKYTDNPLALGIVYARLGMLPEAEQQLRAALKADPSQLAAKRWLHELKARQNPDIE